MIEDGIGKSKSPVDFFIQLLVEDVNPPVFTSEDEDDLVCNSTQLVSVGGSEVETLTFDVEAVDEDEDDVVTLTVANLPAGASMTPGLPISGVEGAASTFSWTPGFAEVGVTIITLTANISNTG